MGEEFYVGVGGKRSEMRVDEEYGQKKGGMKRAMQWMIIWGRKAG